MATSTKPKEERQENEPSRNGDARMTFTAHLGELRNRMLYSMAVLILFFFVCYAFSDHIVKAIASPLLDSSAPAGETAVAPEVPEADDGVLAETAESAEQEPRQVEWVTLTPFENFFVKLRFSAYGALVIAFPFIIYQICAFVFPGLKPREKKIVQFALYGCAALSVAGAAVAFFLVIPTVLQYLMQFTLPFVNPQFRLSETLSVILRLVLVFALVFQFPMAVLVLVYMGLLTPEALKRNRRVAIVGMFVVGALLTPPDPLTMLLMALPMLLLYEFSILVSYVVVRRKEKAQADA
ncbi:MAG: twin-arginine translocase subunit TatC [Candidatus Hydrogenedentes bacterium]|nr:twin-arginine translocase subunit TatC [Candidatus Hydrogenedentota bacterium]